MKTILAFSITIWLLLVAAFAAGMFVMTAEKGSMIRNLLPVVVGGFGFLATFVLVSFVYIQGQKS